MERQKFRIKRKNARFYGTATCSTTGTTGLWPLNFSVPSVSGVTNACSDIPIYSSLGVEVFNALNGDMTTFPEDIRNCSINEPCVILWNTPSPTFINPAQCRDNDGNAWVKFEGIQFWSAGTPTSGTYNEIMDIYDIYNADPTLNSVGQLGGFFTPILTPCFCENPLEGQDLSHVKLFMSQDFNDIGHYTVFDGNISQKDVFSNFLFTSFTNYDVRVFNTTDFSYYKHTLPSNFTIDWGDGSAPSTLIYPNLSDVHSYPNFPQTYMVTITQQTPWGPQSISKSLTVPNLNYMDMFGQSFVPTTPGSPGFGQGGLQPAQNQTIITGPPLYSVNGTTLQVQTNDPIANIGSATTYHTYYGSEGSDDYLPLDSGVSILQYSGMSPTPCFEVSGVTESSLGSFQTYSTSSNDPNLGPGYFINIMTPLGGDVENPLTNTLENQLEGMIFLANTNVTGYTIQSSTPGSLNTPIDFYDFANGITIFVAQSCGPDARVFGGEDCYKCPIENCLYCEEKDEYIDRVTFNPTLIQFDPIVNTNYAALGQAWSPNIDYLPGDIVFDVTANLCCCFMVVKPINQSNPVTQSPWAFTPPAMTAQGVWQNPNIGQDDEHIYEACCYFPDCDCAPCPDGTLVPCNDFTLPAQWGGPNSTNGGVYLNGTVYNTGQFIADTHGNCYKALQTGVLGSPTGMSSTLEWEYTGCISWICPTDPLNIGIYGCEPISGSSTNVINSYFPTPGMVFVGNTFYQDCLDDFNNGVCPYPERWVCDDQYSCNNCIPIYPGQVSPGGVAYNDPSYPFGPLFSAQSQCDEWCNPSLFSCTTPTIPCCATINCSTQALYFSLTNMIPNGMSALDVLINYSLYQAPTYTLADCQSGSSIEPPCCVVTYDWDCESGCTAVPLINTPSNASSINPSVPNNVPQTLQYCQLLNNGGLPGIQQIPPVACGWSCTTPYAVYNPYDPGPPPYDPYGLGYYSSPCTPCYTIGCAPFPDEISCVINCSGSTTCFICDCSQPQGWYSATPCPTPNSWGSNVFGPNNGVVSDGTGLLTYATANDAIAADCCDEGWDCWIINDPNDPNNGQPTGDGCKYYPNASMVPSNLTASTGGPYSSFTECCIETGCCYSECDWFAASQTTYSNTAQPTGFFPCVYLSALTSSFMSCHPLNPAPPSNANPFCTIQDCYSFTNPANQTEIKCPDDPGECVCCSAYTWSNYGYSVPLTDRGVFNYPGLGYQMFDTVEHQDADSPLCCYICMCPSNGGGGSPVNGLLDCDGFIPDDGPAPTGQPNCWESCTYEPTISSFPIDINYDSTGNIINITPSHCPSCLDAYSAQTYECTPNGCQTSSCVINPAFSMTSQNCYDTPNCVGISGIPECVSGCYCQEGPGGSGAQPWSITGCVVLQDFLNQTDNIYVGGYPTFPVPGTIPPAGFPNNLPNYPFTTLNLCLSSIPTGLDCCDEPRYWCENMWSCGQLSTGQGCLPIYPGDPNYSIAPFTNLQDCQDYCTWECDPVGLGQCQFVANSTAAITFSSGPDCEIAHPNCDCKPIIPDEWYCDDSGTIGITPNSSNCINIPAGQTPPNPGNTWGIIPATLQPCAHGTPGCFGFGQQSLCEAYCTFCCDVAPPGSSFCQLSWGNPVTCDSSLYDCVQTSITTYGQYPCVQSPDTRFCCDQISGCQPYIGAAPAGCFGQYLNMNDCQTECNFFCDDCVPTCECIFTGPVPNSCMGVAIAYTSMTQCENAVLASGTIGGGKGCCDCWECYDQGGVTYQILNSSNLWVSVNQTVNFSSLPALPWVSGQIYSPGDVVLAGSQPGADPTCCYVLVYPHYITTTEPVQYYQQYLADLANNTQTQASSAIWIPCDVDCPNPGPLTGWECEPGAYVNVCLGKQIKFGDGVPSCCGHCIGGGGGWSITIPGLDVGRCHAMEPVDVLRLVSAYINNDGQIHSCPQFGPNSWMGGGTANGIGLQSRYYEMPNTDGTPGGFNNVSSCCEGCNLLDDPNDFGSAIGGCLYGINYFSVVGNVDYINPASPNYCVQLTQNFTLWSSFMAALQICSIHPGGIPWNVNSGVNYNCEFDDVVNYLHTDPLWNETSIDDWLYINWQYCPCVDQPCFCYPVTGSTGSYPTQSLCEQDCCQYFVCEQNLTTLECECVALPLGQVGPYATLAACQNDPTTCCAPRTCTDCVGQTYQIYHQDFNGVPYPNGSTQGIIGGPFGPTYTTNQIWSSGAIYNQNNIVQDPNDGCCYYQIWPEQIDDNIPGVYLAAYPPSVCYSNWLLGLACDGSSMSNPTNVTAAQAGLTPGGPLPLVLNGGAVWWPCKDSCPSIEPSGSGHEPSGDCEKCCMAHGFVMQLPPNANPCKCPLGYYEVPCDLEPSGSGEEPVAKCKDQRYLETLMFDITASYTSTPTIHRFCTECNLPPGDIYDFAQSFLDLQGNPYCDCCDDIPYTSGGAYSQLGTAWISDYLNP